MRRLRTCPLGQLQGNGQSCFPYLPHEQHAKLTAPAGVTDVTGSRREGFYLLDARRNFKKTAKRFFWTTEVGQRVRT